MTVKTKGVLGLCVSDNSRATLGFDWLAFRKRSARVDRVGLGEVAKIEARKIEPIAMSARVSAMLSAKACGEVFFFMMFSGQDVEDEVGACNYSIFFYGETNEKFQKNMLLLS